MVVLRLRRLRDWFTSVGGMATTGSNNKLDVLRWTTPPRPQSLLSRASYA